mmetsp:Transcript_15918/g.31987  ORF Transcript_15918/g.31987 Transcript_15918/m.31987 type:complete len:155 (-) Transcript_15918:252-716(-)
MAMRRSLQAPVEDENAEFDLTAALERFEETYVKECAKERPAPEAKFNYAWALIRSKIRSDIKKGLTMMKGLLEDRFSDRDCLYYMALGYYRLDDVLESRRCLMQLLELAPNCRQAISLLDIVEDKITRDGLIGVGIAGAAAVAVAGFFVALSKR